MSQDGYDLSSKSIYATTQESSGFDASDFSLVGSGFCVDSGDNFYPRFALKLTNSAQAENFCLDWCAQNTNPDLVGVHVYAGPSDLTVCQCLFSGGLPLGIESTDYDPPATFEHTVNSPGKGPITQTNGNSDWECYKNNVSLSHQMGPFGSLYSIPFSNTIYSHFVIFDSSMELPSHWHQSLHLPHLHRSHPALAWRRSLHLPHLHRSHPALVQHRSHPALVQHPSQQPLQQPTCL